MTPNEFQKAIIQTDEIKLSYKKFYDSGTEIEVVEFLTLLLLMSLGPLEEKLRSNLQSALFSLYTSEHESLITADDFLFCIQKCIRALCNAGEVQLPPLEEEVLADFRDEVCQGDNISYSQFRKALLEQSTLLAEIFAETFNYVRTLSTLIIENPFPVIQYLQTGKLFLGKYEIIEPPILLDHVSSAYKRKYKHALLHVKPMIGDEGRMSFQLIYITGIKGDKSFRQNYFREIVLKNRLSHEQVDEFGELPGGILYKRITSLESSNMKLEKFLDNKGKLGEHDALELGLAMLEKLEELHSIGVLHSNVSTSSIYLIGGDISKLYFLDLDLAIWEPLQILNSDSHYFQQLPEDMYQTQFRDEDYLSPEHMELAEEYRRTDRIPKQRLTPQCDLYGIAAIMYRAVVGEPPVDFSQETEQHPDQFQERDMLDDWECPSSLQGLKISNGLASFFIKALSKHLKVRHQNIEEMRTDLIKLKERLEAIPPTLLEGLGHKEVTNSEIFADYYTLDLRTYDVNDFTLEYLYKFVLESNIPNLRVFGGSIPLQALKSDSLTVLDLSQQSLYGEDLKVLALFLAQNKSLNVINLSKNPLLQRHPNREGKMEELDVGLIKFLDALQSHSQLIEFRLAKVEFGLTYSATLCASLQLNLNLEILDLKGCKIGPGGTAQVCRLCKKLQFLRMLELGNNQMGDQGCIQVANLLKGDSKIIELDLEDNQITSTGGDALAQVLTHNFTIQRLMIGQNNFEGHVGDVLSQSVAFNIHFNQMKLSNEKFGEYAYNLIGENIKRWVDKNRYVHEKLRVRLHNCQDDLDSKLAEILLDSQGNLNLRPIPMKYTYNPGEGTVHFE